MSAVEMIPQVVMGVVSRAVAQEIGVGMLGYAFMGKAHSNAFRKLTYMTWPPPLVPKLELIAGRNEEAVREAAERYGYERWTTDWHDLVGDPAIGLFDNGGPNAVHAEPTILAAQAGKHVLCEKPLGRDAEESHHIWREVDDATEAAVEFESGAIGTLESTRLALGRRNAFQWEINGNKGSLAFDMERLNELQVFKADGDRARGFKTVLVSEGNHPFWQYWWPPGHIIGWGDTFVHELHHFLAAIAGEHDVAPHGATFEDGYRASEVCDAIVRSSQNGRREQITYR